MIHPDMATMLAFMATDAPIAAPLLRADRARGRRRLVQRRDRRRRHVDQRQLRARRDRQGADRADHAAQTIRGSRRCARRSRQCAVALAQAIVRDGEGATKFIAIRVEGGTSVDECRRVAFGIAHSPLVKTAFFASDPNLGPHRLRDRQHRGARYRSRRASRSGSTTCSWSTAAGAPPAIARRTASA